MAFAEILAFELWGNNLIQYLLFIGVVLGAVVGTKLVYFLFSKIFHVFTKKTTTKLDDLLVDALEGPIIFAIVLAALQWGSTFLTLSEVVRSYFLKSLGALVVINVSWLIVRIINALLANYFLPLAKKKKGTKASSTVYPILKKLVNIVIYIVALIIILDRFGVEITGLVAGLGIGGLAFALAAQDILGNMFGGAAVLTDKPFEVGDRIIVANQDGIVQRIGLRSTIIQTFDGTHIVIPNKQIADSVLENVSREKMRRINLQIGIEYNTSVKKLEKAKKILADIVKENKSTDNKVDVHFVAFGDSALTLRFVYWINNIDMLFQAQDEINTHIKKAFEKEKIEFAYPSQTIYLKK